MKHTLASLTAATGRHHGTRAAAAAPRVAHVVVLPVAKDKWVFASPPLAKRVPAHVLHHQQHLAEKAAAAESSATALPPPPAPPGITQREWWTQRLTHDWPARVSAEWDELAHPDAAGWKRSVHRRGSQLLERLEWEELVAKRWDAPTHVHLYHPASVEPATAERQLATFVRHRLAWHLRYRKYSAALLPATALLGILPGPNLPLVYNGFRAYSHHMATTNLQTMLAILKDRGAAATDVADLDPTLPLLRARALPFPSAAAAEAVPETDADLAALLESALASVPTPDGGDPTTLARDVLHAVDQIARRQSKAATRAATTAAPVVKPCERE
ncbi:hypothetical protein H9P43_007646 [Blastocladiella emersonii ATCC 22665]|nr:hypothetical protein H9P43_007646 [Blastocladiella emersonii ATCC 22665]